MCHSCEPRGDLGVDFIVHYMGFDERGLVKGRSPLDELGDVVRAVSIPVQAVGGRSIEQAIQCPSRAPLVVIGAPLVIDGPRSDPLTASCSRYCSGSAGSKGFGRGRGR